MAPAAKTGGKGLSKKVGGQSVWLWAAELGGAVVIFLWWRNRQAAAAAAAAAGAPQAGVPSAATQAGAEPGVPSSTAPSFASVTQWLDSALSGATTSKYSSTQAFNDFTNWMNGNCVTAEGATAIGNAIQTLGLPPSGQLGAVSVCASPTPAPAQPSYGQFVGAGYGGYVPFAQQIYTVATGPGTTATYSAVPGSGALASAIRAGQNDFYYMETPGNFVHLTAQQAWGIASTPGTTGTTMYVKSA